MSLVLKAARPSSAGLDRPIWCTCIRLYMAQHNSFPHPPQALAHNVAWVCRNRCHAGTSKGGIPTASCITRTGCRTASPAFANTVAGSSPTCRHCASCFLLLVRCEILAFVHQLLRRHDGELLMCDYGLVPGVHHVEHDLAEFLTLFIRCDLSRRRVLLILCRAAVVTKDRPYCFWPCRPGRWPRSTSALLGWHQSALRRSVPFPELTVVLLLTVQGLSSALAGLPTVTDSPTGATCPGLPTVSHPLLMALAFPVTMGKCPDPACG